MRGRRARKGCKMRRFRLAISRFAAAVFACNALGRFCVRPMRRFSGEAPPEFWKISSVRLLRRAHGVFNILVAAPVFCLRRARAGRAFCFSELSPPVWRRHFCGFCRRKAGGVRAAAHIIISALGAQIRHVFSEFPDSEIFPWRESRFQISRLARLLPRLQSAQIWEGRRNFPPPDSRRRFSRFPPLTAGCRKCSAPAGILRLFYTFQFPRSPPYLPFRNPPRFC